MPKHTPATHRLSGAIALALAAGLGLGAAQAQAATLTVTSSADPGNAGTCTLRQAITTANHGAAAGSDEGTCRAGASGSFGNNDRIVFDTGEFPPGGANTITLAGSRLAISAADLAIDGGANGNVTIDANHASRVMVDSAATGDTLLLSHLTLRNGKVTATDCSNYKQGGAVCIPDADLTIDSSTISNNSGDRAGGIFAYYGNVMLTNSTVSNNSGAQGGGITSWQGNITLINTTVSGNSSNKGGCIFLVSGEATLINTTVSGNSASYDGGAIYAVLGDAILTNSTISGNSASNLGGGIVSIGGRVTANNSIISDNTGGDVFIEEAPLSGSHNLVGPIANLDLGPLANNGGPTLTMMPRPGSAAIDAGDDSLCPATDQRGVPRPQNAHCDIGATEAAAVGQIVAANGSGQTASIWHGFFNPLQVQVNGPMFQLAPGVKLHVTPTPMGQPGARCTDATTNATGSAYLYCRANGNAGSYTVEVSAVGWPSVAPATFVLTNVDDGDTLFRDGFDPPGPRTSMLMAGSTEAHYADWP